MNDLWKHLNEAQQQAVLETEGAVMAIAGAGSGKTSVLTRRIAHLIFNVGIPNENILAITFTNKAALEMKERIAGILKMSTRQMWISTFHAMCARILREHIERLGYKKHFQIIDDDDTLQMVKALMKQNNMDIKVYNANAMKSALLSVKVDRARLENMKEPLRSAVETLVPIYQKKLKDNNLVDFEDLMLLTIELLRTHSDVRSFYQKQFEYILVDEFQDTNNLQYQLIKLLVNEKQNVFIVGDEDQSIYAFRGANIENIRKFKRDFSGVKIILLEQNYRSTNTILKAANQVIKGNRNRIEKNLYSEKGEGEKITFFKGVTGRDEVEYVAETIRVLVHKGYRYKDFAVLYRANSMSRLFEETFMQKQISYRIYGNTSFFKRKEIKDMVAYLRLLVNKDDDYSFSRVVNEPKRGIGAKSIENLSVFADTQNISLMDAIDDGSMPLGSGPTKKLRAFKALIERLNDELDTGDFNRLIDVLLEESGYKAWLDTDERGDVRYENILELKTMLNETEGVYKESDRRTLLTYVLEDIALKSQEEEEVNDNTVTLMTLHSAKGLEFKVVFIVGLENGIFPLQKSMSDPGEIEEERRLMYVGITRACEKLYFTNAQSRSLYGEFVTYPDSMFIKEIDEDLLHFEGLNRDRMQNTARYQRDYQRTRTFKERQKALNNQSSNDLYQGDKIIHKVFGEGVVVSVVKDQCTIAFDKNVGIKTLMKDHPAIKKVKKDES